MSAQNSPQRTVHQKIDTAQAGIDQLDEQADAQFNSAKAESVVFQGIDRFQDRLKSTLPQEKHGKYLDEILMNLERITGPETLQPTIELITLQLNQFEAELNANQEMIAYSRTYMSGRDKSKHEHIDSSLENSDLNSLAYAPILVRMMKNPEDFGGDEKVAEIAKQMVDAVAVGLERTKTHLKRTDMVDTPDYKRLNDAYAEDLKTFVEVTANVGDSFESPTFREVGKQDADGQSKYERIAKYTQEAIRVMPLKDGITWVKKLMKDIDANNWQSEKLKAAYGSLAMNCRMGLKAKLDAERKNMTSEEYQKHCLDQANLFTDREGDIDSDLVDPDFAAEILKSSINYSELAMKYAEHTLKKPNPLKAQIRERKNGVLDAIEALPADQKALPQMQKALEVINGDPKEMKELSIQYAVIRSLEAKLKGNPIPDIQAEVTEYMTLYMHDTMKRFEEFLDLGTEGASIEQLETSTGVKFSPEQIKAYNLLKDIEGFGLFDVSDSAWNTTAECAKISAMIVTGVAVGIATGGAGFAIMGSAIAGSAVVGGTAMTAAGALLYQKGFDDLKDAAKTYGADFTVNAVGFGAARVLQAGRVALQLKKAGMLDTTASTKSQIFSMANQKGALDVSITGLVGGRTATQTICVAAEAVCDYSISSLTDTIVNTYILGEGTFWNNLKNALSNPMNIGFIGVGIGMEMSPAILRKIRTAIGKAKPETLHGMDQALRKAKNAKDKLSAALKAEGIAWKDFARSSNPEAIIQKLPADKQADTLEQYRKLRTAQREFTERFPELDLSLDFNEINPKTARWVGERGGILPIKPKVTSGREHHLRTDSQSHMRLKEMIYLDEGLDHLRKKFGNKAGMKFMDVTGMGVGNKYLYNPENYTPTQIANGEHNLEALKTVDESFKIQTKVFKEIFGDEGEIMRFGGDEIAIFFPPGDSRVQLFVDTVNARKKAWLIDKIGKAQYEKAKNATNKAAISKYIMNNPDYKRLERASLEQNKPEILNDWLRGELSKLGITTRSKQNRPNDLLELLAEKLVPTAENAPKMKGTQWESLITSWRWLEPLDFYQSAEKQISLTGKNEEVRKNLLEQIALGDKDVGWTKKNPGKKVPEGLEHNKKDTNEALKGYLMEAEGVQKNIIEVRELEKKLNKSKEELDNIEKLMKKEKLSGKVSEKTMRTFEKKEKEVTKLKMNIARKLAQDPGSGALRFDRCNSHKLSDIIPVADGKPHLEIRKVDIPFFGVLNNHYDYAKADEVMRRLRIELQSTLGDTVDLVRHGGSFYVIRRTDAPQAPEAFEIETKTIKESLESILKEYTHPKGDPEKIAAMGIDVKAKRMKSGSRFEFGEVDVSTQTNFIENIDKSATFGNLLLPMF